MGVMTWQTGGAISGREAVLCRWGGVKLDEGGDAAMRRGGDCVDVECDGVVGGADDKRGTGERGLVRIE